MKKEITKLENSAVKLTVTIPKEETTKAYNDLLVKYSKTMQLPGFRKGKVPVSILERKYGESLKMDVFSDIIEKSLEEIFQTIDEKPLGYAQPELDGTPEFDLTNDFVFSVKYDILPAPEVKNSDGITVELPIVAVSEADIAEELKQVQDRNSLVVDKNDSDKAAKDDITTVNYSELDEKGEVIADTQREDFVFTIGTGYNIFKFDDDIIGMKKGDSKDIIKTYADDFEDKDLAGKTKKIRVTVTALKVKNLPALDDELAQDVSEKYKTLDDLKKDIRKKIEGAVENKIKELKTTALIEQLIEKNPVELPQSMIAVELESRWRMLAQRFQTDTVQLDKLITLSGQTKEGMLEAWRGEAEKALKGRVIVESLLKERKIEVSPEDIEKEYVKIAELSENSLEEVKKHYADVQRKEYLIDDMKEQRLYDQLFEKVTVKKGETKTVTELFKNEQAEFGGE